MSELKFGKEFDIYIQTHHVWEGEGRKEGLPILIYSNSSLPEGEGHMQQKGTTTNYSSYTNDTVKNVKNMKLYCKHS